VCVRWRVGGACVGRCLSFRSVRRGFGNSIMWPEKEYKKTT
jgi:hypothetical protein